MKRPTKKRGFILLLVLAIGVAALAVAVGVTATTGQHTIAEQHSVGGDEAQIIAQSGMERTEAWLAEIVNAQIDFDTALDPQLGVGGAAAASCNPATGTFTAGTQSNVPLFSDGGVVSFNGKNWREVSYGGGAYLVRVEDNDDDESTGGALAPSTSNNPGTNGTAPFCTEGPLALGNNPFRDTDRAVWLTAIGIWPGTDPVAATHRAVMRKLVSSAKLIGNAPFTVGGDFDCSFMTGNNTLGGIAVGGDMNCNGSLCGSVTSQGGTNNATANGLCPTDPFSKSTGVAAPAITVPLPTDKQWYDWTTPCNFYWKDDLGLFFWDNLATRGGVACNTYAGDLVPPDADPSHTPAQGACWTPIALKATGNPNNVLGYEPFEPDGAHDQIERSGPAPATNFRPKSQPASTYADGGAGYTAAGHTNNGYADTFTSYFTGATTAHLPDWATCSTVGGAISGVKWNPPLTGAFASCAGSCDGSNATFQMNTGGSGLQLLGPTSGGVAAAYVVGIYFIDNDWNNTVTFGNIPATQGAAGWPMITLAFKNDVHFPNNNDVPIGVGTAKGGYPSLIVKNNLDQAAGNANLGTAGAVFVGNDANIKKHWHAFGPITVKNHLKQGNGGNPGIVWDYTVDMTGTGSGPPPVPPIVSYPVNF